MKAYKTGTGWWIVAQWNSQLTRYESYDFKHLADDVTYVWAMSIDKLAALKPRKYRTEAAALSAIARIDA